MENFSEACENAQIRFRPGDFAPLDPPYQGFALDPQGA